MADRWSGLENWPAVLPLLVRNILTQLLIQLISKCASRIVLHIIFVFFSLRTSETSYLNEAFSFYSAIRQRSYYHQVNKEDRWKEATMNCNEQSWCLLDFYLLCSGKFFEVIYLWASKAVKIVNFCLIWYSLQFINLVPSPFHRPELVVKKLRYYARFIVVCLLLNKMDLVKVLVKVSQGWQTKWTNYTFLVHGSL